MRTSNFIRRTEGAAAIVIAITLFVFIGAASLVIDIGHLNTVRNELQNVADAAALAGVAQLIQKDATTGNTVRNSDLAKQTAIQVAQTQSQLQGQAAVDDAAPNDLTIHFGIWNINAPDRSLAWADLGTTCASDSNANAMLVTVKRATGNIFGPGSNLFAQVLGYSTTEVAASATAYLDYPTAASTGTVTVPLALPQTVLSVMMPKHHSWFARLFAPREAFATTKSLTFGDLGGQTWYNRDMNKTRFDTNQAFLFIVNSSDSVPGTVVSNLQQYYTSGGGKTPIYVDGFANVGITDVMYKSDCLTVGMPDQVTNPDSCRNTCSVTVSVPTDQSPLSPPGRVSGGLDHQHLTAGAKPDVGAFATQARLVR
jgi:Flp pilus assembly protein TadG